jgi:hypothetical protein
MIPHHENPLPLVALETLDAFDTVTAEDIEACRCALRLTPPEFAEHLGWSLRKYQRTLEAIRDDRFADRDVALAVRGLAHVLLGTDDDAQVIAVGDADALNWADANAKSFLDGRVFPHILKKIVENSGEWTSEVTRPLLRLLAGRAIRGKLISWGEAATTLEERKLATHVWPLTVYGFPLNAICNAMIALSREGGSRIPLLSAIMVKASGQPGPGIDEMVRDFVKQLETGQRQSDLLARLKRDRVALIQEVQDEVFAFPHWIGVLRALGLEHN